MGDIELKCTNCGDIFNRKTYDTCGKKPFCSIICYKKHRKDSSNVTIKCYTCGKFIQKRKSELRDYKIHFCSDKCMRSRSISKKCGACDSYFLVKPCQLDIHKFCSNLCKYKGQEKEVHFNCDWCNKPSSRIPSLIKKGKKAFCSQSCRSKYFIRKNDGNRRSKAEDFLVEIIKSDFPNLEIFLNKRDLIPSGLEIDIFIPLFNLAIEINGICHYQNIYGGNTLSRVKKNDNIKENDILSTGYAFIKINISKQKSYTKLKEFLKAEYIKSILPILKMEK